MTSAQWFYVDRAQQRHGPVPAETVAAAFRAGQADDGSLVWRDGMPQWVPLGGLRAEFGLADEPPTAPRPAPAHVPPAALPPPAKKRMHGCLIALLVVAALGIPMFAILAAIALPAYQDYVIRAQVHAALADIRSLPIDVDAFVEANGRCPEDAAELGTGDRIEHGTRATEFALEQFGETECRIDAWIVGGNPRLDESTVSLTRQPDGQWACTATVPDAKYLPTGCEPD
jgi:type IV pilus assembly protein PilA